MPEEPGSRYENKNRSCIIIIGHPPDQKLYHHHPRVELTAIYVHLPASILYYRNNILGTRI